jgi:hypothetical protein
MEIYNFVRQSGRFNSIEAAGIAVGMKATENLLSIPAAFTMHEHPIAWIGFAVVNQILMGNITAGSFRNETNKPRFPRTAARYKERQAAKLGA